MHVEDGMMRISTEERRDGDEATDRLCTRQYGRPRPRAAARGPAAGRVSRPLDFSRYHLWGAHRTPRARGVPPGGAPWRYAGRLALGSSWAVDDAFGHGDRGATRTTVGPPAPSAMGRWIRPPRRANSF